MAERLLEKVREYLGNEHSWTADQVESAYEAERAAQARVCIVPDNDETWPADLEEALCRRVAHNLALRRLPLGLQTSASEAAIATSRVGGEDAEVRRLEASHRPVVFG